VIVARAIFSMPVRDSAFAAVSFCERVRGMIVDML
jgi:hypothetical protein